MSAREAPTLVRVGAQTVALSNPHKVLFPDDGITKGRLVAYYRAIAPRMLPHLRDRPLTIERYPDGIAGGSFFEKEVPRGAPAWIRTVAVPSTHGKRGEVRFVICDDEATLAYLANLAAIAMHVWTSRAGSLEVPDLAFFDLDPGEGCTLATLIRVALAMRDALAEIGLHPLVKTSGGTGLHLLVPLAPRYDYAIVRAFAELTARTIHARLPEATTLERSIAKRPRGAVYLDYVQVGHGKTLVAPFSVRPRAGAPISLPLPWDEVAAFADDAEHDPERAFGRYALPRAEELAARPDPWRGARAARLEAPLRRARTAWR